MRLSTEVERNDGRAIEVLHAALDAGITLLDTADAYCRDASEIGHNERLVRRALDTWGGDVATVRVATKGGLTRPGGRWVPDGRARHLTAACEASRRALGVERIDLYQLHVVDPRTPFTTSVRALAALRREGLVEAVGLCNVTVGQIEEARAIVEIAAVQVEISPWQDVNLRNGVAEYCAAHGIRLLAHRPLGGPEGVRRLARDRVIGELATLHAVTPAELALAWLADLSPAVTPLPGPTRVESARSAARARRLELTDEGRAMLDRRFPGGRLLRTARSERRPDDDSPGDVVLLMGLPAAGKSTLASDLVARGYQRLNRDEAGGRLRDLVPLLDHALGSGSRQIVLDNTYGSRAARNDVIEAAWRHRVPVRCVWLKTTLEQAQVNAAERMVSRHGRLLDPEEIRLASVDDPGTFAPGVQLRHVRELEPPSLDEGFSRIEEVEFAPRRTAGEARALLLWYDGVLRSSRSGARAPATPDDVVLLPGRREVVQRHLDQGWQVLGLSWHPEIAVGAATPAAVEACFERTHDLLGHPLAVVYCPHADGPPACWCRLPLPGLGVVLIRRHGLDPARCLFVGRGSSGALFAGRLGFGYRDAAGFFQ